MRAQKPPTRRQLAATLLEAIPALNNNSQGLDQIHARVVALEQWHQQEQAITGWQRLKRVVGW